MALAGLGSGDAQATMLAEMMGGDTSAAGSPDITPAEVIAATGAFPYNP